MPGSTDGSLVSSPSVTSGVSRRSLPRPAYAKNIELWTFQDVVNQVLDRYDLTFSSLEGRRSLRAVLDAYRDLPIAKDWKCLLRRSQVTTAASQTTGTVAYDHTGGTYERMVTLTGATFPSTSRYYRISVNGTPYKIEEYKSATVVTLTEDSNPGADVAAGTSYELYRTTYPLPADFRSLSNLLELTSIGVKPRYVPPGTILWLESDGVTSFDQPAAYTIRNSDDEYGVMVVEFGPPPSTSRTYDLAYKASPREMDTFGQSAEYSTGTVSVSGTTVTGSGTAFSDRMVGSVIRFTSGSTVPTGRVGSANDYAPYDEQRIVTAVTSSTELLIDSTLDGSYAAKKFSIGDPVDLEKSVLLTPFLRLAESNMARMSQHNDAGIAWASYRKSLIEAMEADSRYSPAMSGNLHTPWENRNYDLLTGSEGV